MYKMYSDLDFELGKHLDSDEKLIWTGLPRQGVMINSSDALMIPFSLIWGGFAFYWEYNALTMGAPLLFSFFGIPFVLIGLYMIIGRFIYDSVRRKNTIYGLTNNRIIIKSGVLNTSIKSIDIRTLANLSLKEKVDGSGTIVLGPEEQFAEIYRKTGMHGLGTKIAPALEMLSDVRKIYKLITDLQKEK